MIERLLAAESSLDRGDLEAAARLYGQVADADPRNAIAVVGLARIASLEGRYDDARALVDRALTIDPAEAAARRLLVQIAGAPGGKAPDHRPPADAPAQPTPPAPPAPPMESGRPAEEPAWPSPSAEPWAPAATRPPTATRPPAAKQPRAAAPSRPSLWNRFRRLLGLGPHS